MTGGCTEDPSALTLFRALERTGGGKSSKGNGCSKPSGNFRVFGGEEGGVGGNG